MFNNNSTQQQTMLKKPFIREVIKAYETEDDNYIKIWNDGIVDLVSKDLKILEREQYDPADLEALIEEFNQEVKEYESRVENY